MCMDGGWGNKWVLMADQLKSLFAKCEFQFNSNVAQSIFYSIDLYWIFKNSIH